MLEYGSVGDVEFYLNFRATSRLGSIWQYIDLLDLLFQLYSELIPNPN